MTATNTEAGTVADLARKPIEIPVDDGIYAVPEGYKILDLENMLRHPRGIRATISAQTPGDLCDYVRRHCLPETQGYANIEERSIGIVIDHHDRIGDDQPFATWGRHVAIHKARFGTAFAAWKNLHRKYVSQREFAEFLEDRAGDIVAPDAADIIEVATNLQALRKVTFSSSIRLQTGARQFEYRESDEAVGRVKVPEIIAIRTQVFDGLEPVKIHARLRFSIDDGALHFCVVIERFEETLEAEFTRIVDAVKVGLPHVQIIRGTINR